VGVGVGVGGVALGRARTAFSGVRGEVQHGGKTDIGRITQVASLIVYPRYTTTPAFKNCFGYEGLLLTSAPSFGLLFSPSPLFCTNNPHHPLADSLAFLGMLPNDGVLTWFYFTDTINTGKGADTRDANHLR